MLQPQHSNMMSVGPFHVPFKRGQFCVRYISVEIFRLTQSEMPYVESCHADYMEHLPIPGSYDWAFDFPRFKSNKNIRPAFITPWDTVFAMVTQYVS